MIFLSFILLLQLATVCVFDLRYRIIPNKINFTIFLNCLVISFFYKHFSIYVTLYSYLILGTLSISLFYLKALGGGDAKFIIAVIPLFNLMDTFYFVIITSVVGGLVGVIILGHSYLQSKPANHYTVPYGVPLSVAAFIVYYRILG